LPFCVLKCSCSGRHMLYVDGHTFIYHQSVVQIEKSQHEKCSKMLPA
jgi:prepilin-type processing-associated H-X9-DG protein